MARRRDLKPGDRVRFKQLDYTGTVLGRTMWIVVPVWLVELDQETPTGSKLAKTVSRDLEKIEDGSSQQLEHGEQRQGQDGRQEE